MIIIVCCEDGIFHLNKCKEETQCFQGDHLLVCQIVEYIMYTGRKRLNVEFWIERGKKCGNDEKITI